MIERNYLKLNYHLGKLSGGCKVYLTDIQVFCHVIAWVANLVMIWMIVSHDLNGTSISFGEGIAILVMSVIILIFTFWIGYLIAGFLLHMIIFALMLLSYIISGVPLIVEEEISKQ